MAGHCRWCTLCRRAIEGGAHDVGGPSQAVHQGRYPCESEVQLQTCRRYAPGGPCFGDNGAGAVRV